MMKNPVTTKAPAEQVVKDIRRATRSVVAPSVRVATRRLLSFAAKEGIAQSLSYIWSKEFLEAGKKRLAGDTSRQANTGEVKDLRAEAMALKELVADLSPRKPPAQKNMTGAGGDHE